MTEHHVEIGVTAVRRRFRTARADHAWLPHAVLPAAPAIEPWTTLGPDGEEALFDAEPAVLALHAAGTVCYRASPASGRPALRVSLRVDGGETGGTPMVTAAPYEGEALTEAVGAVVGTSPPGTASSAADFKPAGSVTLQQVRDAAKGGDRGACRQTAQELRRAGATLPAALIALAAYESDPAKR